MRILKEYDVVGGIMDFESGDLSDFGTLKLFSNLIKSGKINHLQGHYGRTAHALVSDGWLDSKGNITSKAKANGLKEGKSFLKEAFSRQHYIKIANVIRSISDKKIRNQLAKELDSMFREDNPRFDSEKFANASGVSPVGTDVDESTLKESFDVSLKLVPLLPVGTLVSNTKLPESIGGYPHPGKINYSEVFHDVDYDIEELEEECVEKLQAMVKHIKELGEDMKIPGLGKFADVLMKEHNKFWVNIRSILSELGRKYGV
jgi:hypothetical protein